MSRPFLVRQYRLYSPFYTEQLLNKETSYLKDLYYYTEMSLLRIKTDSLYADTSVYLENSRRAICVIMELTLEHARVLGNLNNAVYHEIPNNRIKKCAFSP